MSNTDPLGPLTTSQPCEVHNRHMPPSHVNHKHHIWPQGEGGPTVPENIVVVCPTGHYNTHELLNLYKVHRGNLPYSVRRRYARGEQKLARLGYQRIMRGAL